MKKRETKIVEIKNFFMAVTQNERKEVESWLAKEEIQEGKGEWFLGFLKEALEKVTYDYWIATIEPTEKQGEIYYEEGAKVAISFLPEEWKELCKNYAPERGSRMANLYELFIWYAWRIAKGYWSYHDVIIDSSKIGNYKKPRTQYGMTDLRKYAPHTMKPAGKVQSGEFKDGQGNTCKLVTHKGSYKAIGGCYIARGEINPIVAVGTYYGLFKYRMFCHGVTVLTKPE